MASYSEAELEALKLLHHSFSWRVSLDRRSGLWLATFAGECIRGETPLGLYDALTLAAWARRDDYLATGDRELAIPEQEDDTTCDCCQERLEQLAATIHEANAEVLAVLDATSKILTDLADLARRQIAAFPEQ
jgi:hypothetical protein